MGDIWGRFNETTYFISTHLEELGEMNIRMMKQIMKFMMFLYIFLVCFFYMLIGFMHISAPYLLFPAAICVCMACLMSMEKKASISLEKIRLQLLALYFLLYSMMDLTDILSHRDGLTVLFPMFLVALSAFYVDYFWIVALFDGALAAEYMVLTTCFKEPDLAHADILLCLGAYLLVLFCYWVVLGMQTDRVTDNRILEEKSSTDLLTGLYNKVSFEEKSKAFLEKRPVGEGCALIIIDFDNFKHVNDEYGHLVGDQVLARCGKILKDTFRVKDIVGRVGGDEFMVMVTDLDSNSKIGEHCDTVQHELNIMRVGEAGQFSASIGIITDSLGKGFKQLYRLADDALYEAKARGKKQYVLWESKEITPPTKMAVYIATTDQKCAEKVKRTLGSKYEFFESDSARVALNEISLYQDYLESIFFDYSLPDISEDILRKYINSRPLFSQIPVHDIQREVRMDGTIE
ncbi:MAG: GGDEF domain-containing protein [Lachnospiraceae bacterium]|nr:GGDEF domain-containing protein [Lachnospiraceae bacterium]